MFAALSKKSTLFLRLGAIGAVPTWSFTTTLTILNSRYPGFVPPYGSGALLFTSRLRGVVHLVDHSIDVSVMNEDEAVDLLTNRSGL
jgi:hypothetical protein